MTPRVAFQTLGCKLNQLETESIATAFLQLGWTVVSEKEPADAIVINTCTVTDRADRKSLRLVDSAFEGQSNPIVVVTGCFAEQARDELTSKPDVSLVVPNSQKNQIPQLVDSLWKGETDNRSVPTPDVFALPTPSPVFHTRASLKIQDGCDNFCSFCIIPSVRGRAQSRPASEILSAARQLIQSGRKEIVLTGVNMGRWSEQGWDFSGLVDSILALEGDFRLRITSLEPDGLDLRFDALLHHPKLCPHLHLCLQSGSQRILLAMRREYSVDGYLELVDRFRAERPDLNITTDMIVGFPGETEEDFQLSLALLDRVGFGFVHVFPYSSRQGTRAERMPGHVSESVKSHRSRLLQKAAVDLRTKRMLACVGQTRRLLTEGIGGRALSHTGHTEDYFPALLEKGVPGNSWLNVTLTAVEAYRGEPVFKAKPT